MLLTDIVGSTDIAARLGDRRWRDLVARHNRAVRRELKRHRGREIDTAGDGFFATFESPTDGVRCASAVVAAIHGLGLRVRAGLHTGEVEIDGEKTGGIAVHIGARLLAMAAPDEVLVSGTLRDLVAGSGLEFEDRGSHSLRGVPGEWRVHALVLAPLQEPVVAGTEEDADPAASARRRTRVVLASLAGVAAVALVALLAVILLPGPVEPTVSGPDSVVAFRTADGGMSAGAATGRGPSDAEVAGQVVWVANAGSGTLTRVQPADRSTLTVGQVSSRPTDIAVAGDLIWVADRYSDLVSILDAATGDLLGRVPLHASALDEGGGAIWATDDLGDLVRRLDPRDGSELDAIRLPEGSRPTDVEAGGDTAWVAASRAGRLLRLDARTASLAGEGVEVPGVERLSVSDGDLWAVSPRLDTATRVDPSASRVAVRATVCDSPVAVAAVPGGGGAWIACSGDRSLWHLDRAGAPVRDIALDGVPTGVALDGDRVWVTLRED